MYRAQRDVFFTLLNIHYKTRNDQIAHNSTQNSAPISAFQHAIYSNNDLRDTYIPTVVLHSVFLRLVQISHGGGYVPTA
jgi:hypothetical protein